jgi:hypothetical protein
VEQIRLHNRRGCRVSQSTACLDFHACSGNHITSVAAGILRFWVGLQPRRHLAWGWVAFSGIGTVPPSTDSGELPNLRFSFDDAHIGLSGGGWTRQVTARELGVRAWLCGASPMCRVSRPDLPQLRNLEDGAFLTPILHRRCRNVRVLLQYGPPNCREIRALAAFKPHARARFRQYRP